MHADMQANRLAEQVLLDAFFPGCPRLDHSSKAVRTSCRPSRLHIVSPLFNAIPISHGTNRISMCNPLCESDSFPVTPASPRKSCAEFCFVG